MPQWSFLARLLLLASSALAVGLVTLETAAAVASAPPAVPADLVPVLERAARYVLDYEQAFHDIAAEEAYTQWTEPRLRTSPAGPSLLCTPQGCRRTTRADVVFVRLEGEVPWGTFRDVFEVDGQKVRDREARLESLFGVSSPASGLQRVQAILKESSRYNVGPAVRNINFPTLALAFLHPRNQRRFAWKRGGTRRFGTVSGLEVEFEETARPTLVGDDERGDLPAKGRFWIDAAHGTVLRSETTFRFEPDRARAYVATQYRAEPKLAMWVPDGDARGVLGPDGPPRLPLPERGHRSLLQLPEVHGHDRGHDGPAARGAGRAATPGAARGVRRATAA